MKTRKLLQYTLAAFLFVSCSEKALEPFPGGDDSLPINLSSTYPVTSTTRATDNGFVADDAVGIFVVDYADGNPGEPALSGNRASNVKFSFDGGQWKASYQLYWANGSTPADFYGYYPFDEAMESVTNYAFTINRQQNSDATSTSASGYEKSDFLWAKAEKIMPTAETVCLQYNHLMAGLTIMLEKGSGFADEEWTNLDKTVMVESTMLAGSVNIHTGEVIVGDAEPQAITPLAYDGTWRAVVFPQTVEDGKPLISITIDGQSYYLKKTEAMTYLSGKMHNFTITVDKSASTGQYAFTLKSEDIVAWIDDPELHDGLVRQYTIVNVDAAGTLQQTIAGMGKDYDRITAMKVVGEINSADLDFMGQQMTRLVDLNLLKAVVTDGEIGGFANHSILKHIVFPEKGLTAIKAHAFYATGLTGALVIPEGVTSIGTEAFMNCKSLESTLTLPSTLKRIEGAAFAFTRLSGELRLPEGIEYISPDYYYVFQECNFEGTLYLPESLTTLPNLGFSKVSGNLVIPRNITSIPKNTFEDIGCNSVKFHDGITQIGNAAFRRSQLSGELVLPANLKHLGGNAFTSTKITKIIFPDALRVITDGGTNMEGAFAFCSRLSGTVEFAKNVARIPIACFRECTAMTGIVLSENVEVIDELAFYNCYSLTSIVCENPEPPVVYASTFLGVPKDNFTLEVPKGSVEKYRNAPGWSEFKRISEYSNFVCRPAQVNALNAAHTESIILNADGAWAVEYCPSWVSLSSTSGNGKTELRLTFNRMEQGTGHRSDSIRFRMTGEDHTTYCKVAQYDYAHEEDSYTTLQTHSKGNGIDILFVGDGYDGEDIANGNYLGTVEAQMECFFAIEPYKSLREYFNVYAAFPLSQEKGVNTMYTYVNNYFGTLYGYDGTIGTTDQLLTEADRVYEYATAYSPLTADKLSKSLIILVPNSSEYLGNTIYRAQDGAPLSICPPSGLPYPQDLRGVIQHEAGGHGFGRLGDETITRSAWASSGVIEDIEKKHRQGWYQNLATTSKMANVPWADFIFDTRYSDFVDVYEGGAGYMRGIFRPETNSCMNYGIPYYNAPSRLSIMQRIFDYAGEPFDMDYFYRNDSKEWGSTEVGTRGGNAFQGMSYGESNLHRSPQTIQPAQVGKNIRQTRMRLKAQKEKSTIR